MMRAAKANYTYASFDAHLQKVAAMKPTMLLMITVFLTFSAISQAESPFSSLQSAKEKTTVLQDLRKICTPQASLSDEAWEKLMLSDENNKLHPFIRIVEEFPSTLFSFHHIENLISLKQYLFLMKKRKPNGWA